MSFCKNCNNLLNVITTHDSFILKCIKCETIEYPKDEDTLRYMETSEQDHNLFKIIMANVDRDPVSPKVFKICACGSKFAKQARIGNEKKLFSKCIQCGIISTD
jgi:hypothetical protein